MTPWIAAFSSHLDAHLGDRFHTEVVSASMRWAAETELIGCLALRIRVMFAGTHVEIRFCSTAPEIQALRHRPSHVVGTVASASICFCLLFVARKLDCISNPSCSYDAIRQLSNCQQLLLAESKLSTGFVTNSHVQAVNSTLRPFKAKTHMLSPRKILQPLATKRPVKNEQESYY